MPCILNKRFRGLCEWDFISQLEVESERYGFSKVEYQTVLWRKKEIMTFENIIRYIIMSTVRKLQGLLCATSLISVWKLIWVGKPS